MTTYLAVQTYLANNETEMVALGEQLGRAFNLYPDALTVHLLVQAKRRSHAESCALLVIRAR
jgi:hypothetical protein